MIRKATLKIIQEMIDDLLPDKDGYVIYDFITISDGIGEAFIQTKTQKKIIQYLESIGKIEIKEFTNNYAIFKPITSNDSNITNQITLPSRLKISIDRISYQGNDYEPQNEDTSAIVKAISYKLKNNKDYTDKLDEFTKYINGIQNINMSKDSLINGLRSIQRSLNKKKIPLKIKVKINKNQLKITKL